MKKNLFVICILFSSIVSSCGGSSIDAQPTVAIAYASGGKGDQSYNDAASKAVSELSNLGVNVLEFEPSNLEEYRKGLDLLTISDPEIVFCIGFLYEPIVTKTHLNYPETLFVVLDGSIAHEPNVTSIKFDAFSGSYLAGSIAAEATNQNSVAFIGGMDIPIINEFQRGFERGVTAYDSKVEVKTYYVSGNSNGFRDPVKGKFIAHKAIEEGADVIFHASGSSGNGIIRAAQEQGISVIGVDEDQSHLAPGTVITSMIKNLDAAIVSFYRAYKSGEMIENTIQISSVEDGGVSMVPPDDEALRTTLESALNTLPSVE